MNINATFVVQCINFSITYLVVRKVLIEPYFNRLAQREASHTAQQQIINRYIMTYNEIVATRTAQLAAFKLRAHITKIHEPCAITVTQLEDPPAILATEQIHNSVANTIVTYFCQERQ